MNIFERRRQELGISGEELARQSGVFLLDVYKVLTGKCKNINIISKVAKILDHYELVWLEEFIFNFEQQKRNLEHSREITKFAHLCGLENFYSTHTLERRRCELGITPLALSCQCNLPLILVQDVLAGLCPDIGFIAQVAEALDFKIIGLTVEEVDK